MKNTEYYELEVWIRARKLVKEIYLITNEFPSKEKFALSSQMHRAAISIPSNIAEGCGRQTPKDTLRFLFIARGSLYEVETQCFLAHDLAYLPSDNLNMLLTEINTCKKLINGFIRYYRSHLTTDNG